MPRNLVQIATQALAEIGLTPPTIIVGNSDTQALQVLALLNREGEELADVEGGWPQLRGEQTITLIPGQEAYDFPADILYYRQGSAWDKSTHWRIAGPLSDRQWQAIRSGLGVGVYGLRYRIMDDQIHFDPVPGSADTLVFEYVSANWCQSKDGTPQSAFAADTDTPILPEKLFVLGLKWRLLAAKGMNYAEERAAYDVAVAQLQARSETAAPLKLNRRADLMFDPARSQFNVGTIGTDITVLTDTGGNLLVDE